MYIGSCMPPYRPSSDARDAESVHQVSEFHNGGTTPLGKLTAELKVELLVFVQVELSSFDRAIGNDIPGRTDPC